MRRRKKIINNTDFPLHALETVARCILPDIIASYETEEGQREFEEWKAQQETLKQQSKKPK